MNKNNAITVKEWLYNYSTEHEEEYAGLLTSIENVLGNYAYAWSRYKETPFPENKKWVDFYREGLDKLKERASQTKYGYDTFLIHILLIEMWKACVIKGRNPKKRIKRFMLDYKKKAVIIDTNLFSLTIPYNFFACKDVRKTIYRIMTGGLPLEEFKIRIEEIAKNSWLDYLSKLIHKKDKKDEFMSDVFSEYHMAVEELQNLYFRFIRALENLSNNDKISEEVKVKAKALLLLVEMGYL